MQRSVATDRLRGLAIILVLGLHFFGLSVFASGGNSHDRSYIYRIFGHGYFGVTIFFVISGYLIASTSITRINSSLFVDATKFYIRRVTRILPLLLLAVAAGIFLLDFAKDQFGDRIFQYLFLVPGAEFTTGFWLSIAAFYFNWFRALDGGPTHGWFGLQWDVLWSLSVEEQFYFVFPWVVLLCGTVWRLRAVMLLVIIACPTARFLMVSSDSAMLSNFANSVICFDALAIGIIVALSSPWNARKSRIATGTGAVLMICSYICGSTVLGGLPTFLVALSAGLLLQGSRRSTGPARSFVDPVLPAFGKLSYGLYLLHPIAFFFIAPIAVVLVNPVLGFFIALAVAFTLAMISFNIYEKPVERISRAWLSKMNSDRSGFHHDASQPFVLPLQQIGGNRRESAPDRLET
jgi:peptidoglycan/LPS O-acetylase OafA/YrhL